MSAASQRGEGKAWLSAGWILVSGLLALCVLGTWLTARNYRARVFSSANGIVLENQWPESRISVDFPNAEASLLRAGQAAKITVGEEKRVLRGAVVSVEAAAKNANTSPVIIKLIGDPGDPGQPVQSAATKKDARYLPAGTPCAVSIDTTVPLLSDDPATR